MTRPWPLKPDFPSPSVATLEPLFPEDVAELCAGPRRPDAQWTRRADGKRVEVYVHRIGRRAELRWTLDGQWMTPSDHSSEAWARDEMERWRRNDTLVPVQPKAGDEVTLDSGGVVRLCQFVMTPVWRSKQARRSWVVEKVRGFPATGKRRFTVAETEILAAMQKKVVNDAAVSTDPETGAAVIDLMAALKASLAVTKSGPKGAA